MVAFNNAGGDGETRDDVLAEATAIRKQKASECHDLTLSYLESLTEAVESARQAKNLAEDMKVSAIVQISGEIMDDPRNAPLIAILRLQQSLTLNVIDFAAAQSVLLEQWLQSSRRVISSTNSLLQNKLL